MLSILLENYFSRVRVLLHNSSPLNNTVDIVIECAPNDVASPALNGLALMILEIKGRQLDLEKVSETTWKRWHNGVLEMS